MDLEDAFGVQFVDQLPGNPPLETIGKVIDHIRRQLEEKDQAAGGVSRT
jgi:hypothetical protein